MASSFRYIRAFDDLTLDRDGRLSKVDVSALQTQHFTDPQSRERRRQYEGTPARRHGVGQSPNLVTGGDRSLRRDLDPGPGDLARVAHDELVVRNDVYLNEWRARNTIALTIHIEAASGETVTTFREKLPSSETSDHVPVVTRVPLRTLSPGLYRLVVEASSTIRPGNSEVREVPFVIVE